MKLNGIFRACLPFTLFFPFNEHFCCMNLVQRRDERIANGDSYLENRLPFTPASLPSLPLFFPPPPLSLPQGSV